MNKPHTNRRYQVLGAARRYIETHKKSPTMKELGKLCGITSTASVLHYLKQLELEGLIERGERYAGRSIKLCGPSNFMRLPTRVTKTKRCQKKKTANEKKAEAATMGRRMSKAERLAYEDKCLERAVRLGKRNDAKKSDPLHDKGSLFSTSGRLTATKVG